MEEQIEFIGQVKFEEILSYYGSADIILFPSYIETFGLPLIEAAYFNKTIICADEEYAKEVLMGYGGISYVSSRDIKSWGEAILSSFFKNTETHNFQCKNEQKGWKEFFKVISYEKDR